MILEVEFYKLKTMLNLGLSSACSMSSVELTIMTWSPNNYWIKTRMIIDMKAYIQILKKEKFCTPLNEGNRKQVLTNTTPTELFHHSWLNRGTWKLYSTETKCKQIYFVHYYLNIKRLDALTKFTFLLQLYKNVTKCKEGNDVFYSPDSLTVVPPFIPLNIQ